VTQLALPPLRAEESQAIVVSVPGTAQLPAARCQQIVVYGAGNPFFVEELAWHAVEDARAATPVPATVHAVLAARLDRLPTEAKHLVQHAAVIGTKVPGRLLQRVAGLTEDALQRGLAHLQDTEVLSETRLFPDPVYTFTHALTHEVAYGSLLLEWRRGLHARIVEALETLVRDRVAEVASGAKGLPTGRQDPDQIERLAHHALRGEVWDKAVTYCQQAGARAFDRAAFREAVAAFEQALQALTHLPEHGDSRRLGLELRLALGGALYALGEYGRCLALLGEAEVLARTLDDRARLGRVLARMSRILRMTGDHDGAIAAGRRVHALAAALGDSALQGEASYTLGLAYYAIGDFGRATELLRQNAEAADRESGTSGTDVRIRSQAWLGLTLSTLGAFTEGRRHGEEALRLATLAGHGNTPIIVHGCLGLLYLAQGDLEHASQIFDQGLALCQASGNRDWLTGIVAGLGYAAVLQGCLAEGCALLEEGIGESLRTGGLLGHASRGAWLSEGYRLAGRGEEAWQHARQALDLARQQKARGDEASAMHQLGIVYAYVDPPDVALAETHYRQALVLAEDLGMSPLQAHCHRSLGMLYAKTGQRELARTALATAFNRYRAMEMTFWLPETETALAQVAA
jgi:tetratricopeptide (TPR) repeat protein